MPLPTSSPPFRGRAAGALVKGIVALVAITGLLIGIPAALIAIGGNPLPTSFPGWSDVTSALTRPDDGSLFLTALLWIAWLGWASFAAGLLVEILAALRGTNAPRLPALRLQQQAAAGLVSAVAAIFIAGPVGVATASATSQPEIRPYESPAAHVNTSAPASTAASPASASSTESPAQTASPTPTAQPAAAPEPAHRMHVVRSGESLWRIAENELGDGARWPEIAELNYGLPQPDGQALDNTHWIDPGWRLLVPVDPPKPAADQASEPAQPDEHVVVKGDTLWDIADEKLGDPTRYPELFEASRDTIQPDGRRLRDPDLIIPGWTITVPVAGTDAPAATPPPTEAPSPSPPASETPAADEAPPPADEPTSGASPVGQPGDNELGGVPEPDAQERVPEEPAPEEPAAEEPAVEEPAAEVEPAERAAEGATEPDQSLPIRTMAGVGSLLAAAVVAYVAAKRRSQQRRRRPGQRIAMPTGEIAEAERELRTVADPLSVQAVDRALRGLARRCAESGLALPPVRIARLTAEQFEVYLTEPAELPPPFVGTEEGHVWFLPASAQQADETEDVTEVPAPYPSLVTIGHGLEDGHLMLDLERLGTLALVGDPAQARDVAAALAVELATSPWADDLQITLVGLCPELADGLDTGRIRYLPSVGTLLEQLTRRAEEDRTALVEAEASSLDDARARGVAAAAWTPEIVLLGASLTGEQSRELAELIDSLPRVAVAAVTSGTAPVGDWALELDTADPETAMLQPVGVELNPQRLDEERYRQVLQLLGIAEQPAQLSDDTHSADGTGGISGDQELTLRTLDAELSDLDVHEASGRMDDTVDDVVAEGDTVKPGVEEASDAPTILLLGPVEVEGATGPIEQSKYRQLTEIATYIALHPGLDHLSLDEAIWPGSRVTQNTRNTAISKLRRWFGRDPEGAEYLPRVDTGYRFHAGITTDWDRWTRLVGGSPRGVSSERLLTALELVRGQPFTGVSPRRYAWAEHLKQEMISAIVDAAHELAMRSLKTRDAHLARKAATIGLQVEPGMEMLWRDRIMAEHLANNKSGIENAVARMTAISDELGDDLEDATIELIHELLPSNVGARPGSELSNAR